MTVKGSKLLGLLSLPEFSNVEELSVLLRLSEGRLKSFLYRSERWYREYDLPKKTGGVRRILQPSRDLKAVQAWVLRSVLEQLSPHEAATAFRRGVGLRDNALPHVGASAVLSVDLEDFFPSVPAARVAAFFASLGYSAYAVHSLTSLCTLHGGLPQGAPSSPALANLICRRLDLRVSGLAGARGLVYTRYADDLTVSGYSASGVSGALRPIREIVESEGFRLNEAKTRIAGIGRRRAATGLVIREDSVGVSRVGRRRVRAIICNYLMGHAGEGAPGFDARKRNVVLGHLGALKAADPESHSGMIEYVERVQEKAARRGLLKEHFLVSEIASVVWDA